MTNKDKYIGIGTILKIIMIIGISYLIYYWFKMSGTHIPAYQYNYNICMNHYSSEYKGIITKNYIGGRGRCFSKLSDGTIL